MEYHDFAHIVQGTARVRVYCDVTGAGWVDAPGRWHGMFTNPEPKNVLKLGPARLILDDESSRAVMIEHADEAGGHFVAALPPT